MKRGAKDPEKPGGCERDTQQRAERHRMSIGSKVGASWGMGGKEGVVGRQDKIVGGAGRETDRLAGERKGR